MSHTKKSTALPAAPKTFSISPVIHERPTSQFATQGIANASYEVFTPENNRETGQFYTQSSSHDVQRRRGDKDYNGSGVINGGGESFVMGPTGQQEQTKKLTVTNSKNRISKAKLEIRPDDDVQSHYSTLTFYHKAFPQATEQVIAQRCTLSRPNHRNNRTTQAQENRSLGLSPSMILKKRIIDEVKMIVAGRKILQSLRLNQSLISHLTQKYQQLIIEAEKVIKRSMVKWYYRTLFTKKRIFVATLYLETGNQQQSLKPTNKVQVFGNFTVKPWQQKNQCIYDQYFKCFKAEKVRIKSGQQFKFVVDDNRLYLTSQRYGSQRDSAGIENNVFNPSKINRPVIKKPQLPQAFEKLAEKQQTDFQVKRLSTSSKGEAYSSAREAKRKIPERPVTHGQSSYKFKPLENMFDALTITSDDHNDELRFKHLAGEKDVQASSHAKLHQAPVIIIENEQGSQKLTQVPDIVINEPISTDRMSSFSGQCSTPSTTDNSGSNKSYLDFVGQFEMYFMNNQPDLEVISQSTISQYCEQDGAISSLEQSYQLTIPDHVQQQLQNANIFDINLEEETFADLSQERLKERRVRTPGSKSFMEAIKQATLGIGGGSPTKHTRGATMESRFRLSSISEAEEHARLRQDTFDQKQLFALLKEPLAPHPDPYTICKMPIVEEETGPEIKIVTGCFQLGKTPVSCEDAFFIHERGFGVADGVSGWNDYGFSSSMFSTQLMHYSKEELDRVLSESGRSFLQKSQFSKMRKNSSYMSMENLGMDEEEEAREDQDEDSVGSESGKHGARRKKVIESDGSPLDKESVNIEPTYVLDQAYRRMNAVGSSTALIAIRNQKTLHIANLGDSGFILIRFRNGEAYAAKRSKEQQHSFNIPYQLSILPGKREFEILKKKGRIEELKKLKQVLRPKGDTDMCQDLPEHAEDYSEELQDGDIIVTATDGVFDNLFSYEIYKLVHNFKLKHQRLCTKEQADQLAEIIVNEALEKVKDKRTKTPFQRKYKKTYNATWEGGKEDDITALVTFAVSKYHVQE